jgi:hypothetical protein
MPANPLPDIRPGETLVVVRLDRLARSVKQLLGRAERRGLARTAPAQASRAAWT